MVCKKCGEEIKDGNNFCTNCGTPVNKVENNKDITQKESKEVKSTKIENNINVESETKEKSKKLKIMIPIIIILIFIGIVVAIIFTNKNEEKLNTSDVAEEQQETSAIEIGTNYNCSTYGVTGYINFNTETSYVMNMTYDMSESVTYNGTYKIEGDTITLTVTYYDMAEDPETFEPYTETINILEDGTLKYTSSTGATYIFDKNVTLSGASAEITGTTTGDLLEQIYAKYPSLQGTEGIVCTDGTDYWLLDETGNKVYFTDLTSFESALLECNIDVNNIGSSTNNTNNNSSNTNVNKSSSTTSKSNINQNNTVEQERTFKIDFHRSCLAENFLDNINDTLDEPLNVTVKADDKVIFTDQITNADLRGSTTDNCKTSIINYTGTTPPTITVLVNGNTFRTYDKDYTSSWFYSDSTEPHYMGFTEHGAG